MWRACGVRQGHGDGAGTGPAANKAKGAPGPAVKLTSYPGTVRQLIVTGLGREAPTVIITNDNDITAKALTGQYARRMTIEQRLAEIIQGFCADALSSAVNLNVDPCVPPGRRAPDAPARQLRQCHPRHRPAPLPRNLRVPKTCATWAKALQSAVERSVCAGPVLARPEVG